MKRRIRSARVQCRLDTHQKKLDEGKQALGTLRDEHKEVNAKLCRWLSGSDEAERENRHGEAGARVVSGNLEACAGYGPFVSLLRVST